MKTSEIDSQSVLPPDAARTFDYDVLHIGSGHASNHGAKKLAAAGLKVGIIEQDKPGGTCTNYGCDAKSILDGPFEVREAVAYEVTMTWNDIIDPNASYLDDSILAWIFEHTFNPADYTFKMSWTRT